MLFVEIYGLLSMRRRTRQTLYELASLQHSKSVSSCLRARERAHHTIYCWVGKRRKRHKIVFRCCAHFSRSFKPHFSTLKTIHSNGYELQVFGFALVSIFVIFNWLCVFFIRRRLPSYFVCAPFYEYDHYASILCLFLFKYKSHDLTQWLRLIKSRSR